MNRREIKVKAIQLGITVSDLPSHLYEEFIESYAKQVQEVVPSGVKVRGFVNDEWCMKLEVRGDMNPKQLSELLKKFNVEK